MIYKDTERENARKIIEGLDDTTRFWVMRLISRDYVLEDVVSLMEDTDLEPDAKEEIAEKVAERFAVDRDYDCNLSYWDNINAMIREEMLCYG